MTIDAHVHTYPSREIGRQAMMGAGRTDYGGTPEELLGIMDGAGITHAVMVNMTPFADMMDAGMERLPSDTPPGKRIEAQEDLQRTIIGRLERRNQWTCEVSQEHPRLLAFIGLDPCMGEEHMLREIEARHAAGARGIKLHPAAQRFYPNDRVLWPVYDRAASLGWPIIFHSGAFALGQGRTDHAALKHFPDVLAAFPRLTVVMGHMGWADFETCSELATDFPNAMFDCCFVISATEKKPTVSDDDAAAGIRKAGIDRVMFGSDYPWSDPALDSARIAGLALTDDEKRAVLRGNAERVFGLVS